MKPSSLLAALLIHAIGTERLHAEAWEFFFQTAPSEESIWTNDISRRGIVFKNPGACLRSAITYCAPRKL